MNWLQEYTAAKRREEAARQAEAAAKLRATTESAINQRELQQLVQEAQKGKELVKVQHAYVTKRAKALHGAVMRDFDSAAPDKELAERITCTESELISALAELVHTNLVAMRVENGKRRLMAIPL